VIYSGLDPFHQLKPCLIYYSPYCIFRQGLQAMGMVQSKNRPLYSMPSYSIDDGKL